MTSTFSENYRIQELEPCDPVRDKYVLSMSWLANMNNAVPWWAPNATTQGNMNHQLPDCSSPIPSTLRPFKYFFCLKFFRRISKIPPVPAVTRSKAWVYGRSLLGWWVRIPPGAWIFLSCEYCCQVEVSASGWSLVQRSPTECGMSECDRETSIMMRPWSTWGCCTIGGWGWGGW
jgi:hypothetical protein